MSTSATPGPGGPQFEAFAGGGLRGEAAPGVDAAEAARLADPASSVATIHWGRNFLYAAELRTASGTLPVVVKQFSNQGLRRRLERRLRGSKAERSWRVAGELLRAGLATPEPLMWIESEPADGPSFFVARRLEGAVEVRHFFRRLNGEADALPFPEVDDAGFLARLGGLARRLHDAGIVYRDLSMGNILAVEAAGGDPDLFLVDFNRARTGRRPGAVTRTRDICRLPILRGAHRAAYLGGYWGAVPPRWSFRWWFFDLSVRGYILKHALKRRLRGLRLLRRHSSGGSHHPHIPPAAAGAAARDKAVWDHLSDQPHQHAGRLEKVAIRLSDAPSHLRDAATVVAAAGRVWRRYRELKATRSLEPRPFSGIGLALRPWPADPEAQLREIAELGVGPLLLRLHPWEDRHDDEERLAAALAAAGHELSFAIPQTRELVRDRGRWRAAVADIAERFSTYGWRFQVGQAVNRSKWGVWTHDEYLDLYLEAAEILRRRPGVEVMGPAVIDFEFQSLMALVNRRRPGLRFDIVSSLLYVDRRGAPENRQLGLDTADKVTLLRAIADTGRCSAGRCWITEVNWPLWEGPHSPAGKSVSVGEEEQADYLVRYYLLALGTGLVERVFWWRLIARGYGLVAPETDGALRRRPAWHAMRTLIAELDGATFQGALAAPAEALLYRFALQNVGELVVGWSLRSGVRAALPRPASRVLSRDGEALPPTSSAEVTLDSSPTYFYLAAD